MNTIRLQASSLLEQVAQRHGVAVEYAPGRRSNDVALARVQGDKQQVMRVPLYVLSQFPQLALELIEVDGDDNSCCLRFALSEPHPNSLPPGQERRKRATPIQLNQAKHDCSGANRHGW